MLGKLDPGYGGSTAEDDFVAVESHDDVLRRADMGDTVAGLGKMYDLERAVLRAVDLCDLDVCARAQAVVRAALEP